MTADGINLELFCNIGTPKDAKKAVECDGEGVGLFRSEFLFMDNTKMPTEDEQFAAYKEAAETLGGKPVIIRTLDVGGDKDIPYLNIKKQEGYLPLKHRPGEGQADFGTADFVENGKLYHEAKYLVLSFPYSNGGYLQLNYGENMECLLESLVAIFEHIGGVPSEIWFDNTSTIVTKVIKGGDRKLTPRFQLFCEHYRFKPVFMNPESGWEKGNVECKVGYLRHNELVPVPEFESLREFNKELLKRCDEDMAREHYEYDDGTWISDLFKDDREALLPLPSTTFDTARYETASTNKYGKFTLNEGKHIYSVSPEFGGDIVNLKIKEYLMSSRLECFDLFFADAQSISSLQ